MSYGGDDLFAFGEGGGGLLLGSSLSASGDIVPVPVPKPKVCPTWSNLTNGIAWICPLGVDVACSNNASAG